MTPRRHLWSMPRYFFHVHNIAPRTDDEGEDLSDDEAAWKEATTYASDLLNDIDGKFRPGQEWTLEVTDEAEKPLYLITISSKRMR